MPEGLSKYQIIYNACIETNIRQMRVYMATWDKETMLQYPKDYCSFKVLDVDQEAVKDLTAYMRRHHKKMGLIPIHGSGQFARYMFAMPSFRKVLLNNCIEEENGHN